MAWSRAASIAGAKASAEARKAKARGKVNEFDRTTAKLAHKAIASKAWGTYGNAAGAVAARKQLQKERETKRRALEKARIANRNKLKER